jgi:hypothetical protein
MRRSPALILGLALGLATAMPVMAEDTDASGGFPIIPSAPGPRQILDDALARLAAHDLGGVSARIEMAQNRLINDSLSGVCPQDQSASGMRDAVPVLDVARQALARGNEAGAVRAVQQARGMV